jgi:hypothetical protein
MDDPSSFLSILLRLTVVLLLVLANGFFVAAEFSLVGMRRSRVAALVAEGNPRATILMRVIEQDSWAAGPAPRLRRIRSQSELPLR